MTDKEKIEDYDNLLFEFKHLSEDFKREKLKNKKLKEQLLLHGVSQQRELLIAFTEHINKETEMWRIPINKHEIDEFLAINCG